MSQSKLPPKVLEAAAKAADGVDIHQSHEDAFLDGVEWLWSHLSEQAPEFDASECSSVFGLAGGVLQLKGARWMFDQMKAREAALRASGRELANIHADLEQRYYLLTKERDELRAEVERLKATYNRRYSENLENDNAELRQERDKLRAEVEELKRNAWNKSDDVLVHENTELTKEVERLKRALAELQDGKETMSRFLHEKRMSAECERTAKLAAALARAIEQRNTYHTICDENDLKPKSLEILDSEIERLKRGERKA